MVKNIIKIIIFTVNCKGILLQREDEVPRRKRMGFVH
jgi:hypothetical protein